MGSFSNGMLVGLGISLLIAPMKGEEMRRLLAERFRYVRGIPPENEQLQQSVKQMEERVQSVQEMANRTAQMQSTTQDYAQQTAQSANTVQRNLSEVAQQAGTDKPEIRRGGTPERTKPHRPPRQL